MKIRVSEALELELNLKDEMTVEEFLAVIQPVMAFRRATERMNSLTEEIRGNPDMEEEHED